MKMTFVIASLFLSSISHASESESIKDAELKREASQAVASFSSALNVQFGEKSIVFRGTVKSMSLSDSGPASSLKDANAQDLLCTLFISNHQGPGVHVELGEKGDDRTRRPVASVHFEGAYYDDGFTKTSAELSKNDIAISKLKLFKVPLSYEFGGTYSSKSLTQITIAPIINDRIEKLVFADFFRDVEIWNLMPIPVIKIYKNTGTCVDLKRIQ